MPQRTKFKMRSPASERVDRASISVARGAMVTESSRGGGPRSEPFVILVRGVTGR